MTSDRKAHWQRVYTDKEPTTVSWFQPVPESSLRLIQSTGLQKHLPILDVGGGASTLVDHLLASGYTDISVLDISAGALATSRARLGDQAQSVTWIAADVTAFQPARRYALWHDRAAFHFLTSANDRARYIEVLRNALQPGGDLVLATFGPDGPMRCSGLDICRYGIEALLELFGAHFTLQHHELEAHQTPAGSSQQFLYSWWRAAC
ncbi:MAG: class I SAM-dependent methyltransferase [Woeseiaceae bacterium]|nr:class I SAM-dependent methyltransferase [Woeseiaceae bacterium]